MATFETSLVSPEALVFYGEVEQVDLPGTEGDLGVLAGHDPIVTALRPGIVRLIANGKNEEFVVLGGIAEFSQSILSILADTATPIAEFDALDLKAKWINASRLVRSAMSWIVRSERLITTERCTNTSR
jgi:F-type H+-transporting ATPase subunit epsilon